MKTIHIDDGDALNIDCVVVNKVDSKDCKCFYSCDLIDRYEARLKADKLAMLTEIQLEIEELEKTQIENGEAPFFNQGVVACEILIQKRIDALRGNEDEP